MVTPKGHIKCLKPSNKKRLPKVPSIYGFDIETCNDNKTFLMASLYGDDGHKCFYSKEDLKKELLKKKYGGCYIVATNLHFDFFGTFSYEELGAFNLWLRGSNLMFAYTKVHEKKFCKTGRRGARRITFIDTLNYAQLSVKEMGNILNLPKLDVKEIIGVMPKNKDEWERLKVYNIRDAEISYKFMKFLFEGFISLGGDIKMTIASTSLSIFRNKYLKETFFTHKQEDLIFELESYYGGRTECFARGNFEDYNYYDFNSLYPSVMEKINVPHPNFLRVCHFNDESYIHNYEGCSNVTVIAPKMKYPVLPYKTEDKKLYFPYGRFTGTYCHNELRYAISKGYKIAKIHKTHYYKKTCSPFKEMINELYALRLEYKKNKNPMERVVKLVMNSLYGKFGQKFLGREKIISEPTIEELEEGEAENILGDIWRVKVDSEPANFCIPIWASYITAQGRIDIHNVMEKYNAIYGDTDSIITKEEVPSNLELGGLKKEDRIIKGFTARPKFYYFLGEEEGETVKAKGVGMKLSHDLFVDILKGKSITTQKFTKIKEAMRRNLIPNQIINVTKNLDLNDTKRKWEGSLTYDMPLQWSEPLSVEEIEEMQEKGYTSSFKHVLEQNKPKIL